MKLSVKEKIYGSVGLICMMMAACDIDAGSWKSLLCGVIWMVANMAIAFMCFAKLEQIEERKEKNEQRRIAESH